MTPPILQRPLRVKIKWLIFARHATWFIFESTRCGGDGSGSSGGGGVGGGGGVVIVVYSFVDGGVGGVGGGKYDWTPYTAIP